MNPADQMPEVRQRVNDNTLSRIEVTAGGVLEVRHLVGRVFCNR